MPSRHRYDNLTQADLDVIRTGMLARRSTYDVAREVGCSQRTVVKYYHRLSGRDKLQPRQPRSEKRPREEPRQLPPPRADRFYHSNFEPS